MKFLLPVLLLVTACVSGRVSLPGPEEPLVSTPDATFRATPPLPGTPHAWGIPEPENWKLPNGTQVLLLRTPGSSTVAIDFAVRGAGETGAPETVGLASLVGTMLADEDNGARAASLAEERGLQFQPRVTRDGADFQLEVPRGDWAAGLNRLVRAMTHPVFHEATLERLRVRALDTLLRAGNSPEHVGEALVLRRLYGVEHPLAAPIEGVQRVVNDLSMEEGAHFHFDRFRSGRATVIVVGDITRAELEPAVARAFLEWQNETPHLTRTPPPGNAAAHSTALVHWYGLHESIVVLGQRGVDRTAARYPALLLLAQVIADRLGPHHVLHEGRPITPMSRAWVDSSGLGTTLFAAMAVKPGDEGDAAQGLLHLLRDLTKTPVSPGELAVAKAEFEKSVAAAYDAPSDAAATLGALAAAGLPSNEEALLIEQVESFTAADLMNAAHDLLKPEQASVVVLGDPRQAMTSLKKAGFKDIDVFGPG